MMRMWNLASLVKQLQYKKKWKLKTKQINYNGAYSCRWGTKYRLDLSHSPKGWKARWLYLLK